MKLIEVKESTLGYSLNHKNQKRKSYKWYTKLKNRACRKYLKRNIDVGNEIYKKRYGYEF